MTEIQWYYARQDQQFGPVMAGELKQLAQSGALGRDDLVWREGLDQWTPAGRVKGLFADTKEPLETHAADEPPPPPAEPLINTFTQLRDAPAADAPLKSTTLATHVAASAPRKKAAPVPAPASPQSLISLVQGFLWGVCVLVVLVGGIMFLRAISRAEGDDNKIAAAGATYMTFFIGSYVIARAGEKISRLLATYFASADNRR